MGVADLVRRKQAQMNTGTEPEEGASRQGSTGSSLVLVNRDDIKRLKGIIGALRIIIEKTSDGSGMARMAFLMSTFADELADELQDMPELTVRKFMFEIGQVISWIGHGHTDQLPNGVREFAEMIQPSEVVDAELVDDDDNERASTHWESGTKAR